MAHRMFRRGWRRRARPTRKRGRPLVTDKVIMLIKQMAKQSHSWASAAYSVPCRFPRRHHCRGQTRYAMRFVCQPHTPAAQAYLASVVQPHWYRYIPPHRPQQRRRASCRIPDHVRCQRGGCGQAMPWTAGDEKHHATAWASVISPALRWQPALHLCDMRQAMEPERVWPTHSRKTRYLLRQRQSSLPAQWPLAGRDRYQPDLSPTSCMFRFPQPG